MMFNKKFLSLIVLFFLISCSAHLEQPLKHLKQKEESRERAFIAQIISVPGRPRNPIWINIDKDEKKELTIVAKSPWFYLFDTDEKGRFFLKKRYDIYTHNTYLTFTDLDLDGDIDFIPITEAVIGPLLLNDGQGNFSVKKLSLEGPNFGTSLIAFNLNDDGYPDLAAVGMTDEKIYLYLNLKNYTFKTFQVTPPKAQKYFGNQKGMREIKKLKNEHLLITDYYGMRVLLLKVKYENNKLESKIEELYSGNSTIASSYILKNKKDYYLILCEEALKRLIILKKEEMDRRFHIFKIITLDKTFPRKILAKDKTWAVFWIHPGKTIIDIYQGLDLLKRVELKRRRCEDGFLEKNIIWCSDVYHNEVIGIHYEVEKYQENK